MDKSDKQNAKASTKFRRKGEKIMSIISQYVATPGLKGATPLEKFNCTKEKMGNNLKHNLAITATTIATTGLGIAAVKNDKIAQTVAKLANKVLNSETVTDFKNELGPIVKYLKNNPTAAKALAVIGLVGTTTGLFIGIDRRHKNGKIEGKYQAIADIKSKK